MFLEDEYFPVASPKLAAAAKLKAPRDLLKARIIREDRDYWKQWFDAAGVPLEEAKAARGPLFNDSTYALQAAARGEGIALARRSIVTEDIERGALKRLFDLRVPSRERYWFVCPKETAETAKVAAFKKWVKAELKGTSAQVR
jgi:LysR family glycine cleavage system transcriptional activator